MSSCIQYLRFALNNFPIKSIKRRIDNHNYMYLKLHILSFNWSIKYTIALKCYSIHSLHCILNIWRYTWELTTHAHYFDKHDDGRLRLADFLDIVLPSISRQCSLVNTLLLFHPYIVRACSVYNMPERSYNVVYIKYNTNQKKL